MFFNALKNPQAMDEPNSSTFLAAQQSMCTIITLLLGIKSKPQLLAQVDDLMVQLVLTISPMTIGNYHSTATGESVK